MCDTLLHRESGNNIHFLTLSIGIAGIGNADDGGFQLSLSHVEFEDSCDRLSNFLNTERKIM